MQTAPTEDPQPPAATVPTAEPTALRRSEIAVAIATIAAGALLTFAFLMTRTGTTATAASETGAPVRAAAPADAEAAPVPAWSDANRESWVGSRRGVAYEVEADTTIGVWMRSVRPSLVVRCVGNATDVFVFTDSAARLERDTPDHTVTYRFDDAEHLTEAWPDADAHDALFAPDGAAFARQLARARTLTFGFTPHNAPPVTMRFNVAGLAPLLNAASKQCGGMTFAP